MSEKWDQLSINKNVDTSQTTHISLCSGYGGIDIGLRRVIPGLRTVAYAEIEAFACENLLARMEGGQLDAAPIWSDLKSFPWAEFSGKVDILTGGYPCQPFSAAGKRAGKDDPRHLWPWIADGVVAMRPRVCFFENVEGHITLGLREVIADLESLGYQTTWGIFSAAECGAPHQRKRVFILAHRKSAGLEGYGGMLAGCGESRWDAQKLAGSVDGSGDGGDVWPSRPGELQHAWEPPRVVEHSNSDGRKCDVSRDAAKQNSDGQDNGVSGEADSMGNAESGARFGQAQGTAGHAAQSDEGMGDATDSRCEGSRGQDDAGWQMQRPAEPDGSQSDWEMESRQRQTQPALGGTADGPASGLDYAELCGTCDNRTDELRLLGNGVVPATAALAFSTLGNQIWEKSTVSKKGHEAKECGAMSCEPQGLRHAGGSSLRAGQTARM